MGGGGEYCDKLFELLLRNNNHKPTFNIIIPLQDRGLRKRVLVEDLSNNTAVLIYNAVTNIFDKIVLLVKSTLLYSRILVILVNLS